MLIDIDDDAYVNDYGELNGFWDNAKDFAYSVWGALKPSIPEATAHLIGVEAPTSAPQTQVIVQKSPIPAWLLPAGIIAGIVLLPKLLKKF